MLNYFITYCLCMSAFMLLWFQGKVVVPGLEDGCIQGTMKHLGSSFARVWIMSFVLFFGWMNQGFAGEGYFDWCYYYRSEHSVLLWLVTTPVITLGLWIAKVSTFQVAKKPGTLGWWQDENVPSLHTISMKLPAMWTVAFYGWLLFSPTLPFYTCYVRYFLLHTPICLALEGA